MPIFGHHHDASTPDIGVEVAGLAEVVAAQGLEPVSGRVFDGHIEDAVHEITVVMYESRPGEHGVRIGGAAVFRDAFRGTISGRTVTVANG